ncbi:amino acid adenylation domain-containing protein [Luteibacter sp. Sphag1AF]|uniref:polyketide synthase n=1 Tax=Luteibacter sp. Sphag1AF TaxID=2587031 RepID=UPI0017CF6440|nr:polyketide synthase [Luteibacter sp. Sphag1AF]MBB3228585.1 amino acid adenylation domain-containing protein [Luteibacter sp. Sphag1AF]
MNPFITANRTQDDTPPTLVDVLPCHVAQVGPRWKHYEYALDAALPELVEHAVLKHGVGAEMLFCIALGLVEARLTGASRVPAWRSYDGVNLRAYLTIDDDASHDAWLTQQIHALLAAEVHARGHAPWIVVDTDTRPACDGPNASDEPCCGSRWRLMIESPARIQVDFPAPFTDAAMDLLAGAVVEVLCTLLHEGARSMHDVGVMSADERRRILEDFNHTARPRRAGDTVHSLFAEVAASSPDAVALAWQDGTLTYAQLDAQSSRVAAGLLAAGIHAEAPVGLLALRSPGAIVAMLGILKAGAAYLPLDPSQPTERLNFMLADAGATTVIACGATATAGLTATVLDISHLPAEIAPALPPGTGESLAYVMYTSGSTGTPKGAQIEHRSIIRLVRDVGYVALTADTRVLHAAPLGFDAATFEIWGPLLNGGTCVVHHEAVPTACGLEESIVVHGARVAWLTAALFNAIIDENPARLAGLKHIITGGEALSLVHVRKALEALPNTQLSNGYGPTECTTFATTWAIPRELDPALQSVPVGRPIADTTLYVLNARGEPVPVGVTGELYIGGAGVARGYLGRPELNAQRFLNDVFAGSGGRLYRTGDLVRWREDGTLEFIGRRDGQVKIRGYRIELGEIEHAMHALPGVRDAAVIARDDDHGGKRLLAYYVPYPDAPAAAALRDALARTLPAFMLPAVFVPLESMPITANGKLDRRALPIPGNDRPALAGDYVEPVNDNERALCGIFSDLLGIARIGRDDHFFDLGGSSLLATAALARIHAGISTAVSVASFFAAPTPAAIAASLAQAAPAPVAEAPRDMPAASPVAITAMAGRFPGAADVETFWDNLCASRESITTFTREDLDPGVPADERDDPNYVFARGIVDGVEDFDAAFFGMSPREAELTDPQQRIFMELCWECLERGGYVPDAQTAPVGIFAGMHNATYFQRHLQTHPELIARFGAFQTMLGNEKDYLSTHVAHKLNLTGPAISMNTACSTSLVAIAQAFDALRAGRCDMALAGGSSITCPPRSGYIAQEGSMLSPDGHTRSFDANARGTVFSDGAAVVLLKRLDDALRDGDPVYAVIRGAAVNNDGGGKASFTAPSSAGQAAVITAALRNAGVDAGSLSYVETHGTATPLGDPIEIEGLTHAFRRHTAATGFCAIGSVKSNVGHLVMAAGAAGVIKTALALATKQIPASLHYVAPNPALSLTSSPFVVNAALTPWTHGESPRRAGVSSFGVGGTNAHVILEEAPARTPSDPAEGAQLLLVSARSDAAVQHAWQQLGAHLARAPESNLADVALTLAHGRKAFAQRSWLVADDAAQVASQLADHAAPVRQVSAQHAPVVFLFPGQGSQYAGMGRELYRREPVFRDALDACVEALRDDLGFDLAERMFADDPEALRETSLTQPATFAIEYALARLWMSAGVRPAAMIGHSVGEFAAAVLAGVMSLGDGARLVARRGKLMQAMAPGTMLSVRMDAASLAARLPAELSLAAENAPSACVVSGETAPIETFRAALDASGIACRVLHTSHAFHSAMMDPALAAFRAEVAAITLNAPDMPIISTLTGMTLTDNEAMSVDYWTRHLRGTVRFSGALTTRLDQGTHVFLEVGPRNTLTLLTRQHPNARQHVTVASLADSATAERSTWLDAMGQLWASGVDVDLSVLDRRQHRQRVRLPTYPFERRRHWVDALPQGIAPAIAPDVTPATSMPASPEPSMAMPAAPRTSRLIPELAALFEEVSGNDFADSAPDANFLELGLDSLSLTQVALQLQKTYALKITFRELMENCSSFTALAAHIDRLLPPEASAPVAQPAPAAPSVAAASAPATTVTGNLMQDVIQQQMQIMQQQLALLAGAPSAAVPAPAAAVARTPDAPVADTEEAALAHTTYDVKKAFGAIARIHSTSTELTTRQRGRLDAFMRRYIARTAASKAYTTEHRDHLADPRVVNGFRPLLKEMIYQMVVERSKGSRVWDIDGNEYIDALNGFGMNLFGWQPDFVTSAVRAQLDTGYEIGPQHPLAGVVARQICDLTGFDRAALCNTGSEAVMGTVRIARTVTGRDTLVIFTGSYHGIFDEVIVRGTKKLRSVPAAPGILRNTAENVLVLDYGTPESLAIIRERASTIAAVLVEPVQSRRPDFQPREFLQELRAITEDAGALLIFDEVVTGFRTHPRGAQAMLGIDADLASYGKVVGGGFPIGVIAGKRRFMDALDGGHWQYGDDSVPTVGVTYFAGTFVRHPLALAAAHAVLTHLSEAGPALQESLNERTAAFVDELNIFCTAVGAPIKVVHYASVWKTTFPEDHPMQELLFAMMRSRGIHILDNFPCFFTTSHSEEDFAAMAKAFKDSVLELQEAEFLPRHILEARTLDVDRPPVEGARLGRDAEGHPAWFVPHPDVPGKYLRVNA